MEQKDKQTRFIEKAKKVHAGENLDYSKVAYVNNRTHVTIIDHDIDCNGEEYGEYQILPCNFLKGQGHPRKRGLKISLAKRDRQEDIIRRFEAVHAGENLDYSQVKYVNMHTKVKIICHDLRPDGTEYGEFWQEPVVHLKGCSHPDIGRKKTADANKYTTETFIEKAKKVHLDKQYDYSKVNYVASQKKVTVICKHKGKDGKEHGEFKICPDALLQGKGCPKCGNHLSFAEDEIADFLTLAGEKVERRNTSVLSGQEIDVYLPNKKIGFEYDGLRWHSEKFGKGKWYHYDKRMKAKENGITLIHIFEDEYLLNKEIVLDKILSILGDKKYTLKAPGRKCQIELIDNCTAKDFLNKNHIQGFVSSTVYLGAFIGDRLVAVMQFLNEGSGKWNLTRYCTDNDCSCPGVASKMLTYFIKEYNPTRIKSFLDLRWCSNEENNLYTKLGFHKEGVLKPDYHYTDGHGKRIHKFNFRKQILHRKHNLPLTMTEAEMAKALGYDRIWDCGLIKYVWKRENPGD